MLNKIFHYYQKFIYRKQFIKHNKSVFHKNENNKKNLILVELNRWAYLHVAKSYLSNTLSKLFNAQIVGFESYTILHTKLKKNIISKIFRKLLINFSLGTYGVYKSFGANNFIYPKIDKENKLESKKIYEKKILLLNSKKDICNLKIKNILIGDLIYDSYLKVYNLPTIDFKSKQFLKFFEESISLFFFWYGYIRKNKKKIKAIVMIHSVYFYGLPSRIAAKFNIPSYKCNEKSIELLNNKYFYVGQSYKYLKSTFNSLKKKEKNKGLNAAKKDIQEIISGTSKKGKGYNSKTNFKLQNKFKKNNIKILVSCHSFSDSPHVWGDFFFADFYEWLCFLGKISKITNYTWLIKPHPSTAKNDIKYLEQIRNKYNKFIIIDPKISNNSLVKQKINLALTCFGKVSYEYPYQGIPVINASKNNPCICFNFSYTPKNINEYRNVLLNLNKFNYAKNKREILIYYFIRHYYLNNDWMFLRADIKDTEGFRLKKKFYNEKFYLDWINNWNKKKHENILKICSNFLNSKDIMLNKKHLNF